eukprot:gene32084-41603_t
MNLGNKKKWEEKRQRELLEQKLIDKSISERVEHCKRLQYQEHLELFSVQYTSIHKAALDNSLHGMKHFLRPSRGVRHHVDDYDKNGSTPLHLAAERGSNEVISLIIGKGCEANIPTTYGNTALMYACKECRLDSIRLLVASGADPFKQNKAGLTAIHFAAQSDAIEGLCLLVDLLSEDFLKKNNADTDTDTTGSAKLIGKITDTPVEDFDPKPLLELHSTNLSTPLHTASLYNSLHVLRYLVSQKVFLDSKNSSGETALHVAGRQKHFQVYQILKEAGASPNIRNNCNQTPQELLKDMIIL